jgi:hypothetical protein
MKNRGTNWVCLPSTAAMTTLNIAVSVAVVILVRMLVNSTKYQSEKRTVYKSLALSNVQLSAQVGQNAS